MGTEYAIFNQLHAKELIKIARTPHKNKKPYRKKIPAEKFDAFYKWLGEFGDDMVRHGVGMQDGEWWKWHHNYTSTIYGDSTNLLKATQTLLKMYEKADIWTLKRLNEEVKNSHGIREYSLNWETVKCQSLFELDEIIDFVGHLKETEILLLELSKAKKNTKKGRPNLRHLKFCLWCAGFHYKLFAGENPTFLRVKNHKGIYIPVTNWHLFCDYLIKKVNPYMLVKVSDKQLATACEDVVKQFYDWDLKLASELETLQNKLKAKHSDKTKKINSI